LGSIRTSTHHRILLHTVFSTKQRKNLIATEWASEFYAYIGGILNDHKATLLSAGGNERYARL
jgi:putative transposase